MFHTWSLKCLILGLLLDFIESNLRQLLSAEFKNSKSAILAIIFCSFVMMRQSASNLSGDSHVVVKNVLKMMSQIAEIIIFILLGVTCIEEFIYG